MSFKPRHFVWLAVVLILGGFMLFLNHQRSQQVANSGNAVGDNGADGGGGRGGEDDRNVAERFSELFGKDATDIEVLDVLPIGEDGRVRLRVIDRYQIKRPRAVQSLPANGDDDASGDGNQGDSANNESDGESDTDANDAPADNAPISPIAPQTRDPEAPIVITLAGLIVPAQFTAEDGSTAPLSIDGAPAREAAHAWITKLVTESDRVLAQRDEYIDDDTSADAADKIHWRYLFVINPPLDSGPHDYAERRFVNETMLHFGYAMLADDWDRFSENLLAYYMQQEQQIAKDGARGIWNR